MEKLTDEDFDSKIDLNTDNLDKIDPKKLNYQSEGLEEQSKAIQVLMDFAKNEYNIEKLEEKTEHDEEDLQKIIEMIDEEELEDLKKDQSILSQEENNTEKLQQKLEGLMEEVKYDIEEINKGEDIVSEEIAENFTNNTSKRTGEN